MSSAETVDWDSFPDELDDTRTEEHSTSDLGFTRELSPMGLIAPPDDFAPEIFDLPLAKPVNGALKKHATWPSYHRTWVNDHAATKPSALTHELSQPTDPDSNANFLDVDSSPINLLSGPYNFDSLESLDRPPTPPPPTTITLNTYPQLIRPPLCSSWGYDYAATEPSSQTHELSQPASLSEATDTNINTFSLTDLMDTDPDAMLTDSVSSCDPTPFSELLSHKLSSLEPSDLPLARPDVRARYRTLPKSPSPYQQKAVNTTIITERGDSASVEGRSRSSSISLGSEPGSPIE